MARTATKEMVRDCEEKANNFKPYRRGRAVCEEQCVGAGATVDRGAAADNSDHGDDGGDRAASVQEMLDAQETRLLEVRRILNFALVQSRGSTLPDTGWEKEASPRTLHRQAARCLSLLSDVEDRAQALAELVVP